MRTTFIAVAALLFAPAAASAQERTARNGIYVELGGNGGLWSLNYERFLGDDVSLRIGGSYMAATDTAGTTVSLATFPLTASWLGLRSGSHALEVGAGATFASASLSTSSFAAKAFATGVIPTAILGYRLAPLDGGFTLRAAFTPLFSTSEVVPLFGLALGGLF